MNHKRVWLLSAAITLLLWAIYGVVGLTNRWFKVSCISAENCATPSAIFFKISLVALPVLFIIIFVINYIIETFISIGKKKE